MITNPLLTQIVEPERRRLPVDRVAGRPRRPTGRRPARPTRNRATRELAASADAVFATLTDLDRLPAWNASMVRVVEVPAALRAGAVWKVMLRSGALTWVSRSAVLDHDSAKRRFRYESGTDDGNPSRSEWSWTVRALGPKSCVVEVSWSLYPRTFWRRALIARMRARVLRREVPRSLDALALQVETTGNTARQRAASRGWPAASNSTAA